MRKTYPPDTIKKWTTVSDEDKKVIEVQEWAQVLTILLTLSTKLISFGLADKVSAFSQNVCILLRVSKEKEMAIVSRTTSLPIPSSKDVKYALHHGKYFQFKPRKSVNDK